jgi:hypothetical protein
VTTVRACPTDAGLSSVFPESYKPRPARDRASRPALSAPGRPSPPAAPTGRADAPGSPAYAVARLDGNARHPRLCAAWLAAVVERAGTLARRHTDVSPLKQQGRTSAGTRHISAVSSSPPTAARPAAPTAGLTFAPGLIRRTPPPSVILLSAVDHSTCRRRLARNGPKWITIVPPGGSLQACR